MKEKFFSLKSKIILIILAISLSSIFSTFAFVVINDLKKFKNELVNNAFLISKIIGDYSAYDLTFKLKKESNEKLKLLGAIPNVKIAVIFDSEKKIFSSFFKDEVKDFKIEKEEGYIFKGDSLFYFYPVIFRGERIGFIGLEISAIEMKERIKSYIIFMVLFLFFLSGAVILCAFWLQGFISKPVVNLSNNLKEVAKRRDYSIRVRKKTNDEIGALVDGFNLLLSEVQKHQAERDDFEKALKISQQKFYHIIEQSNDALYVLEGDKILFINPKFEQFFGYSLADVTKEGFNFLKIVYEEDKKQIEERIKKQKNEEEVPSKFLFRGVSKTNVLRYYEANESEIVWDEKLAILGILRDITERIEYENKLNQYSKELERSNKELDQFAYVTSHDLKAPLRAICNLVTWIEEDLKGNLDESIKKNLELLKSRAKRMENLINGILEYSRIGRVKGAVELIDFEKLIYEIIDSIEPPKNFEFLVKKGLEPFYAEKIRLQQVFSNLISNAIKHHDKNEGKIEILYEDLGEWIQFEVKDDGPGIPEEYHNKIFEIFQTLKPRDEFESTGIGLTIVKKIIENQGGKIFLKSKVGEGTSFIFTWKKISSCDKI